MIDTFADLDWSKSEPLDEYKRNKPKDVSNINFDPRRFKEWHNLSFAKFQDEILLHRATDAGIEFFHVARQEGVLCVQTGNVGDKKILKEGIDRRNNIPNVEVTLDVYAPFTFDKLVQEAKERGFSDTLLKHYEVRFTHTYDTYGWLTAMQYNYLEQTLFWTGTDYVRSSYGYEGKEQYYSIYAADDEAVLQIILDKGKKHKTRGKIEIVRIEENGEKVILFQRRQLTRSEETKRKLSWEDLDKIYPG